MSVDPYKMPEFSSVVEGDKGCTDALAATLKGSRKSKNKK